MIDAMEMKVMTWDHVSTFDLENYFKFTNFCINVVENLSMMVNIRTCITECIYFQDIDCMPANWLDNLPDNVRSTLDSHDLHNILEMEHVSELTPSGNRDHTINEVSIPELPITLDITSDQQLEVLFCHTSFS